MAKKTEKSPKTTKWAKTPKRGIDLRVPLFVTDEMVENAEGVLIAMSPSVSNRRVADALSRFPWKDPEAELDLDKVAVASVEDVLGIVTETEVDKIIDENVVHQDDETEKPDADSVMAYPERTEYPEGSDFWDSANKEQIEQLRDIPGVSVAVSTPPSTDPIDELFDALDLLSPAERKQQLLEFAEEYKRLKVTDQS